MAKKKKTRAVKKKKRAAKPAKAKKAARKTTKARKAKAPKAKSRTKTKAAKKPARKVPARKTKAPKAKAPKAKAKKSREVLGEGNYTASRRFRKEETDFVARNKRKIPEMGKAAEAALDGPEGNTLRAAEDEARAHAHMPQE